MSGENREQLGVGVALGPTCATPGGLVQLSKPSSPDLFVLCIMSTCLGLTSCPRRGVII